MRLLGAKYKTYEGARKRSTFENGISDGKYRRGETARLWRFRVVVEEDYYRVARFIDIGGEQLAAAASEGEQ